MSIFDTFRSKEAQEQALFGTINKAKELKRKYIDARKRSKGGEYVDLGPIQNDLNKLIGEGRIPPTLTGTEAEISQRLNDWQNEDLTDPKNFSPNSEIGRLTSSVKGKADAELSKDWDEAHKMNDRFDQANNRRNELMVEAARILANAQNNLDPAVSSAAKRELARLVGQSAAEGLMNGAKIADLNLEGEIGRLESQTDKIAGRPDTESSSETAKKGTGARFKEFIGGIFAEAGKLVPGGLKEKWNATEGSWWDKAKGMFKREKKEETGEETEKGEFWFNAGVNTGKFGHEMGRKIHDILARGGKEAQQLKELISTNKDLQNQLAFLGVNIVANAFHLNPIGFAFGGVGKAVIDEMALSRAKEQGNVDELIKNRFFQATDSKGLAERRAANVPVENADEIAEYNKLKTEVGAKYEEAVQKSKDLQEKIKKNRKTLRKRNISNNQRTALEANLREDTETLGQLSEEIAKIESSDTFQRLVTLAEKLPQTVASEKELSAMDQAGKFLFKALRLGGAGLAVYSNIAKKMLVDLQGSGNDVEAFISKSVDKENAKNVDAIVAKVKILAEGLAVEKIKERSKAGRKERAQLKKDALQIRDLISSLTDLGMFDDIIPRNIGHKQINAFFGRTEIEENKLIRNPELLAELRTKVMEVVKPIAAALGGKEMDWQSLDGGLHEVLSDINYIGAQNEAWVRDRQIEMSRRMTTADIIGIFANGALVYAGTHAGELTEGMKKIIDDFNHERSLSTSGQELRNVIDNHSVGNVSETGSTDTGASETSSPTSGGSANTETSSPTTNSSSGGESDVLSPTSNAPVESTPTAIDVRANDNLTALQRIGVTDATDQLNLGGGRIEDYMNDNGTFRIGIDGGEAFLNQKGFANLGELILSDVNNLIGLNPELTGEMINATVELARAVGHTFTPEQMAQIAEGMSGALGAEVQQALMDLGGGNWDQADINLITSTFGLS